LFPFALGAVLGGLARGNLAADFQKVRLTGGGIFPGDPSTGADHRAAVAAVVGQFAVPHAAFQHVRFDTLAAGSVLG